MPSAKKQTGRHRKHRIFLVEDHPVTREGFARLVNFEPDFMVCGQAGTARTATAGVEALKPDLVVMDISLAGMSGLELIKNLVSRHPLLSILVLSVHDELLYAERALRGGAKGYVMKYAPIEQVMKAIRQVLHGKIYLSEEMSNR